MRLPKRQERQRFWERMRAGALLTCVSSVSCTTLILPIVVLVLAAVAAVFVRGHKAAVVPMHEEEAAVA